MMDIEYQTMSSQPFLNYLLSIHKLTNPLATKTTVSAAARKVFEFSSSVNRSASIAVLFTMDLRICSCPDRVLRTDLNRSSTLPSSDSSFSSVYAGLGFRLFSDVSQYDRYTFRFLTYDLVIIFMSPVPVQFTLNTPIFLSQQVFSSLSACSMPTNSPLLSSEVMQNIPRSILMSGEGQYIKVCCSAGASSNSNDSEGRKLPKFSAKLSNCLSSYSGSSGILDVCEWEQNTHSNPSSTPCQPLIITQFRLLQQLTCCQQYLPVHFSMLKASLDEIPETKRPLQARGIKGNTEMWLKEMSARDTALWGLQEPLWIIENKAYDLTEFAKKHPGGQSWISMTKGQDITALFVTHHLEETRVRGLLSSYYRFDTPIKHENRFDFVSNGHYAEIRSRILAKYSTTELKDIKLTESRCYLLTVLWLVLLSACGYSQSYAMALLCGCLMMIFYGIGHLFIHRKDGHILRHAFLLIGFSAREQQIMHAVSHHPYTNTMLDYEYAGVEDLMSFARCLPPGRWYSAVLLQALFLLIGPSNVLTKLIVVPLLNREAISWHHLIFPLQIIYLYLFTGDFWVALKLWTVMILAYGLVFGKMVLCPHRQIQLWSEGAPEIRDYVLHTIATTCDTRHSDMSAYTSLVLYAGFNIHALHHLFPTIDHHMLPQCNQIFLEYCQEKGLKVMVNKSMLQCNQNMWKLEVGREPFNMGNFVTK